ncbi:unnamed protein product [Toxocara canis]|uniref:Intraflagellar transport protein 46 homolog n=1 Tax=Toxocara canis TaxID=6265 RepID=A0A183V0H6_TOXCA|nr:unnamed protein product [Toxocara canis]
MLQLSDAEIVDSPEKGASKEKQSPEDPPSGLSAAAAMNHSDPNEFDEDDDDELRGGLFSLDEEQPKLGTGKTPKRYNCDYESDAEDESDDCDNFEVPRRTATVTGRKRHTGNTQTSHKVTELRSGGTSATGRVAESSGGGGTHTGALAYGTSLPVTIPAGRFWPPKDAVDSIKERDGLLSSDDENTEDRSKTLLPQRIHKDLYREMQAQARSIQAADDPERLFGERPQRRRYQTGEASPVTPRPLAPHAPHDNAIVIVAASVSSHT